MTAYEVPFSPQPQTFTISLANVSYRLTTKWCAALEAWILDIAGPDNLPLVTGIPLITGTDLLAPFAYLGFGGSLFVQSSGNLDAVPGFNDLGTSGLVFFVTES